MSNTVLAWLALGTILIVAEAVTMPGIGIFLAGLGALITAILVAADIIDVDNFSLQLSSFMIFTSLWALALWKPLSHFRSKRHSKDSFHFETMVGETATVGKNGLRKGEQGQVLWSGTVMNAILDASSDLDEVAPNSLVEITAISGILLTVRAK